MNYTVKQDRNLFSFNDKENLTLGLMHARNAVMLEWLGIITRKRMHLTCIFKETFKGDIIYIDFLHQYQL